MSICNHKKTFMLCLLWICTACIISGCWDRLEIEQRAIVLGIAIDLAEEDDRIEDTEIAHPRSSFPVPKRELVQVTVQIAVPDRIPLGSAQGETSGSEGDPVWVLSTVGHTVDEALQALQQELAYRIFYGHMRIVIISEQYATMGLDNLNDFLRRSPQVRRLAWMAVGKGRADKFMKASPKLDQIPSLYIMQMLEQSVDQGKYPEEFIGKFWSKSSSKGQDAHLPYIALRDEQNVAIDGMACFSNDKLVGTVKALNIGMFMAITNEQQGGYPAFSTAFENEQTVLFNATKRITRRKIEMINGQPHMKIRIRIEGNLEEKSSERELDVRDHNMIRAVEERLIKEAKENHLKFIKSMQELKSDIFGFGEFVRAKHPAYWKREIDSKEKWEEKFAELPVDIEIIFKIRRVGMKAR